MTSYVFPPGGGKPEKQPIPDAEQERAKKLHNELIEIVAENDETLMEHYLEKGELDEVEMREGLTKDAYQATDLPHFLYVC